MTMKMGAYSRNTENKEAFIHRTSHRVFLGVLRAVSVRSVFRCFQSRRPVGSAATPAAARKIANVPMQLRNP